MRPTKQDIRPYLLHFCYTTLARTRCLDATVSWLILQAERKHRHHEAEVQSYQHDWQQHVLRLKNYFERQGLQNVDLSGG